MIDKLLLLETRGCIGHSFLNYKIQFCEVYFSRSTVRVAIVLLRGFPDLRNAPGEKGGGSKKVVTYFFYVLKNRDLRHKKFTWGEGVKNTENVRYVI